MFMTLNSYFSCFLINYSIYNEYFFAILLLACSEMDDRMIVKLNIANLMQTS